MSIATDKIAVTCPKCEQQLLIPSSSAGKLSRCPSCQHIFPLDAPVAAQLSEALPAAPTSNGNQQPAADYAPLLAPTTNFERPSPGRFTSQPSPAAPPPPTSPYPYAAPSPPLPANPSPFDQPTTQADKAKYQHGFGWEHRGWDAGMMGGLAMMAIAALWFFGALAFGFLFPYPIILFVIGLVGFFRGLVTGNISGR